MGGAYRCTENMIDIIKTVELKKEELRVRNPRCLVWNNTDKIKYPLWKKTARASISKYRNEIKK